MRWKNQPPFDGIFSQEYLYQKVLEPTTTVKINIGGWVVSIFLDKVYISLAAQSRHESINSQLLSLWEPSIFNLPQNQRPLTNRHKICHRWLRPSLPQLCKIWWKSIHGGYWANTRNRLDRSPDFHARWLKWCGMTQGYAFFTFVDIMANLEGQIALNPNFWGVKHFFQPNEPNINIFILS